MRSSGSWRTSGASVGPAGELEQRLAQLGGGAAVMRAPRCSRGLRAGASRRTTSAKPRAQNACSTASGRWPATGMVGAVDQLPDADGRRDRANGLRAVGGGVVEDERVVDELVAAGPAAGGGALGVERREAGEQREDDAQGGQLRPGRRVKACQAACCCAT